MTEPTIEPRDEIQKAIRSVRQHFIYAALFSSCVNLLYLSSPLYLMQVYNRVLVNENTTTLILLTIILAVALLTMAALDAFRAQILIRLGVILDSKLSGRVFQSLISRSARQGYSRGAQQLRELDDFRAFITGPGIYFAFDIPWIPIYLILLFFIHPILGSVATIGALALLGLAFVNEKITSQPMQAAQESARVSFAFTENILRHADVIVAMGMKTSVERHWQGNRREMLQEQAYASDKNATISSLIRFSRLLLQSLMLGTGAWLAIDHSIMPATIFAASIILGRALVPVEQGVATAKQYNAARAGYRRVRELLQDYPMETERTIVPVTQTALAVEDLTFRIPDRKQPVLRQVSFSVTEGHAVGIVGPSGSGKSTLARVLVAAVPPTDGKLKLGELDYSQWDSAEFGRLVGYLPQEVGLFAGTVRENIARFGDASTAEIVDAARRAGIHQMILDLPKQYDTKLGPGGIGLSGGQRQRVGLARALLGNPRLLVLDEPNANLDTVGEIALKDALNELKAKGTTIIVITHRKTVLSVVDEMIVLRAGRIELVGPPEIVFEHLASGMSDASGSKVA